MWSSRLHEEAKGDMDFRRGFTKVVPIPHMRRYVYSRVRMDRNKAEGQGMAASILPGPVVYH